MATNEYCKQKIAMELRQVQAKLAEFDAPERNPATNSGINHARPTDTPITKTRGRGVADDSIWDLLRTC